MKRFSRVFALLTALGTTMGLPASAGAVLGSCTAKAKVSRDGTLLVSVTPAGAGLQWGTAAGLAHTPFANPTCIDTAKRKAKDCMVGAAGTLASQTPPAGCTVYVSDGSVACAAWVKGCTPGLRLRDASFSPNDPRIEAVSLELVDGQPTLRFTGVNVQVVSGSGATDGAINGTGNLVVGYGANTGGHPRTGSHNLIVGDEHAYTSFGGFVAGVENALTAPSASVSGGRGNAANGDAASISGGQSNSAGGPAASISGGHDNLAGGTAASVSGGHDNLAGGPAASISGGQFNSAGGSASSISGGDTNVASGDHSSISGGTNNSATNLNASVSGGAHNVASGSNASVGGGDTITTIGSGEWHAAQSAGFPKGTEY